MLHILYLDINLIPAKIPVGLLLMPNKFCNPHSLHLQNLLQMMMNPEPNNIIWWIHLPILHLYNNIGDTEITCLVKAIFSKYHYLLSGFSRFQNGFWLFLYLIFAFCIHCIHCLNFLGSINKLCSHKLSWYYKIIRYMLDNICGATPLSNLIIL